MEAICCERAPKKPIGAHAKLHKPLVMECAHKHTMVYNDDTLDSADDIYHFYGCVQNEYIALHERHAMAVPDADEISVDLAYKNFMSKQPRRKVHMWTPEQVIAASPQSRRARLRNAFSNLEREGWGENDARVRSFIKFEKNNNDGTFEPFDKTPRLIQHRSDEYCARLAQYLMPIEHHLWSWDAKHRRVYSKRMNSWQLGKKIYSLWRWPNTTFRLLDGERWDAHMRALLRAEHKYWKRHNDSSELAALLECQINNKGKTMGGLRYTVKETKCSGDFNTGGGNTIANHINLEEYVKDLPEDASDMVINGDDSILSNDSRYDEQLDKNFGHFKRMGLTMTESKTMSVFEAEFCQCRVVIVNGKPRAVRNPLRVLSRAPVSETGKSGNKWLAAVALGEFACNTGVPVLQEYALMLWRHAGVRPTEKMVRDYMARRVGETIIWEPKAFEVTAEARATFELAWGDRKSVV